MVRAILKKPTLDQDNPSNYRPISLLPWLSKILEKHINATLVEFLETNHLHDLSQIGFCPKHGTETALLAVTEEARRILDQGGTAAIILLDLSAAFDTVNHEILLHRLTNLGVSGKAITWLRSFLADRSFQVFEADSSLLQPPA